MNQNRIAIIGSGITGSTIAYYLKNLAQISVFEKSRGVGGRLATRYTDDYIFDHGAPFFTAKSKAFKTFIKHLYSNNVIKIWQGTFAEIVNKNVKRLARWEKEPEHYIGAPKMTSISKYLLRDVNVQLNTKIDHIEKGSDHLAIYSERKLLGEFDWIISTIPPNQALKILPVESSFINDLKKIKMKGCYSLMVGCDDKIVRDFDMALVKESALSWISFNNSKHNIAEPNSITALSTNDWAENNMDANQNMVTKFLLQQSSEILKHDLSKAKYISLHKWKYANIKNEGKPHEFIDWRNQIAACGDWCKKGIVESAYLNALSLCHQLYPKLKTNYKFSN